MTVSFNCATAFKTTLDDEEIALFYGSGEDEMEMRKTLYVTSRKEWRAWLTKHYQSETEVWLSYYKKNTGRPRISYDQAVEEALCFGWIDSIVKRIDDEKFVQKFTPRSEETRERRLREAVALLEQNKKLGLK